MQNIKLLVFDIDGTLINHRDACIIESTKKALALARAKGIATIIATGRCSYFINDDVKEVFEDSNYFITINGSLITDKHFNNVNAVSLSYDDVIELSKLADKHEIAMGFKFDDAIAVYRDYETFVRIYTGGVHKTHILKDLSDKRNYHNVDNLPLGVFIIGNNDKLKRLANDYPKITWVKAYDQAMEAYNQSVSKANGITWVLEQLKLTWDNVMTFGDGENDIEMTRKAKIGVIMGNAKDNVKEYADFVTDNVLNDGIYNALKHYEII